MNQIHDIAPINDTAWMMAALLCSTLHVAGFFWMCWRQGVFAAFGRRPIASKSLFALALAGAVPFVLCLPTFSGPYSLLGVLDIDPLVDTALLAAGWGYFGFELIGFIGKWVDTTELNPVKEIEK